MSAARNLLARLADGAPHPGSALAAALGVTRAAVWKQVEALRAHGLPITADASGYALPWPIELLDRDVLHDALPCGLAPRIGALDVLWEIDSTSSELLRRGAAQDLSFVLAETQSAGRGRRGRVWLSPPGVNLHLSCLKRFDGGIAALAGLSLAVGVMLIRALERLGIDGITLKWPNDLLAGDAKLAGILVDLDGEATGHCRAIIGIGVNLRLPAAMRAAAGQAVADLVECTDGAPPARSTLAAALIEEMIAGLDAFAGEGFAAFADDFAAHDALAGRPIRLMHARGTIDGIGAGVDARGALQLREGASTRVYDSAEVSVRMS